ncbi:MAG TPA: peptidase C26 [Actinobacteria bacterium]|jgi:putative glutamine amidotransferase|nr:peptidase C26 [Actinomycetota bacterium]
MTRPRIAVLGRFTESASALRYRGVVSSRALLEAIWEAGGDPVTLLPGDSADALDWAARLAGFDGVLLAGGGDLDPRHYGGDHEHESVYDVDPVQDAADLSLTAYCLKHGIPTLAVCRGLHVVNVVRGGTLVVDMPVHHRHVVQQVALDDGSDPLGIPAGAVTISCYHHQAIERLGEGLQVVARADDGTVEAVVIDSPGWAVGVQWHPEDTWSEDPDQRALLRRFVAASAG